MQDGRVTEPADFYEEDEPLAKIVAAFERGTKRLTRRPALQPAVAFSKNERLVLHGRDSSTNTVAAVITSIER